jgi:hypothetical protein
MAPRQPPFRMQAVMRGSVGDPELRRDLRNRQTLVVK